MRIVLGVAVALTLVIGLTSCSTEDLRQADARSAVQRTVSARSGYSGDVHCTGNPKPWFVEQAGFSLRLHCAPRRPGLRLVPGHTRKRGMGGGARAAQRRLRRAGLSRRLRRRHEAGTKVARVCSRSGRYPRPMPLSPGQRLLRYDRRLGVRFVAGADEAGRGSLAGPLVVAGVLLDYGSLRGHRVSSWRS